MNDTDQSNEPTPTFAFQICRTEVDPTVMVPLALVRLAVVDAIRKDHPALSMDGFICKDDLINTIAMANKPFNPYPFILLNLILSCLAAIQAPVIVMS